MDSDLLERAATLLMLATTVAVISMSGTIVYKAIVCGCGV